jgi:hypothetical protein
VALERKEFLQFFSKKTGLDGCRPCPDFSPLFGAHPSAYCLMPFFCLLPSAFSLQPSAFNLQPSASVKLLTPNREP